MNFLSVTKRIEPSSFWSMTHRIELFLNMTQRIEPIFYCDSFFKKNSKNWTLFTKKMTQRIEHFSCMTQRIEPSVNVTQRVEFFERDWKNGTWKNDSKNWNFLSMTQRIDFFLNVTQRIETFFFEYDAENWNLFLWIWRRELNPFSFSPQRIETFSSLPQMIELFFQKFYWLKELNFFFSDMTQRNEIRKKKRLKELNLFFKIWLTELNLFFFSLIWLKELNHVSKKTDSKNGTLCKRLIEMSLFYEPLLNLSCFFFLLTQRMEPSLNVTQRIVFFWAWLKE